MIHLYLAEDQEMLQTALITILNMEEDLEIIGAATNGQTALSEITLRNPDVVILDIEMPKMTGLEAASQLRKKHFEGKIIILTTFARQDYFEKAVVLEVEGYLLKDNPTETLIEAIKQINEGATIYSPELVKSVLRTAKNPLTDRELEILDYINQGLTTQMIAETVHLSQGTVRNYISSILSKTAAQSRVEAVNIAKQHQWLQEYKG